ncbi:MAG: hypothetical protein JXQ87_10435 [Bacteroidia bacterium]
MRISLLITLIAFSLAKGSFGQTLAIPHGLYLVDSIVGDLNKDKVSELVVAYNVGKETKYEGVQRLLVIYKLKNDKWIEWKRSEQALYGSRDGGMMGDPFGKIEIINGILLISQSGGSSWKWGFTDKYRYQNDEFYLIGYTSKSGKICEYWKDIDYNLSTGKMIIKKEYELCEGENQEIYKRENETMYQKELKVIIQNRHKKEIKIVSPKYGHEIYISTKNG